MSQLEQLASLGMQAPKVGSPELPAQYSLRWEENREKEEEKDQIGGAEGSVHP